MLTSGQGDNRAEIRPPSMWRSLAPLWPGAKMHQDVMLIGIVFVISTVFIACFRPCPHQRWR
ncbi:hypothetical protein Kim5_PA00425 (plasmid) [Rhizobium sp. Kim5]|nr:hypothetical protein Kim5_PA00425 [Rhizobium sp. Kim5]